MQQWELEQRTVVQPGFRYGAAGGIFRNSSYFFVSFGFGEKRYTDTYKYNTALWNWFWVMGSSTFSLLGHARLKAKVMESGCVIVFLFEPPPPLLHIGLTRAQLMALVQVKVRWGKIKGGRLQRHEHSPN